MSTYQIAYKQLTPKHVDVIVQMTGDVLPGGYAAAATAATLADASDGTPDTSRVMYHLVKDALYAIGIKDMTQVTINMTHPASITVTPNPLNIVHGNTQQLTVTHTPANSSNRGVTYKSSNPAVATVNKNGLVTGVAAGTCTITVTAVDTQGNVHGPVAVLDPVTIT